MPQKEHNNTRGKEKTDEKAENKKLQNKQKILSEHKNKQTKKRNPKQTQTKNLTHFPFITHSTVL